MARFFFDLQGTQNANDPTGLPFENELDAFRAAQRLAAELWSTRPRLRGNSWVVASRTLCLPRLPLGASDPDLPRPEGAYAAHRCLGGALAHGRAGLELRRRRWCGSRSYRRRALSARGLHEVGPDLLGPRHGSRSVGHG